MAGAFITFEGGEGAGKSTQAEHLVRHLRELGHEVTATREPGGSPYAERLRTALLSERGARLSAVEQAMLFAAARADHVATVIAPALRDGAVVVCDRFADSTEAYQGAAGVDPALLAALTLVAAGDVRPDLTVILDCPAPVGSARTMDRGARDPFDRDAAEVQERRRRAFLAIAERDARRCVVFDATLPPDELAARITAVVEERVADLATATPGR
ncbi:dTMP kinase [Acuticoccus sp.]|uniref:dTMP kinase n=1 Tax=Acuticoccus sp. TaxID=1904378 RepID=UPI003B524FB1